MSWCKIIKAAYPKGKPVAAYVFEHLPDDGDVPDIPAREEFRPMFPGGSTLSDPGTDTPDCPAASGETPEELTPAGDGPSRDELQAMLRDAFDNGFAEGRKETEQSLDNACRSLSEAAAALDGIRERLIRESEEDLLRLAIMVAKRIIQQEIAMDRRILAQFVAEAIREITDQEEIVICFNPDDCRVVSANKHLYLGAAAERKQLTLKPVNTVPAGGCIIDTPTGLVDARIETQLEEIFTRLMQERSNPGELLAPIAADPEPYHHEQYGADSYGYARN